MHCNRISTMKVLASVALISLASCAATGAGEHAHARQPYAPSWQSDDSYQDAGRTRLNQTVALSFGGRTLDSDAIASDVDSQGVFGISIDSYRRGEPFGYEVTLSRSSASEDVGASEISATLTEISFGFRGHFETGTSVIAYVGGGLAGVFAKTETLSAGSFASDDAFSPGFYAHVGAFYPFPNQSIRIGVDYRQMMFTDVEFDAGDETISGDVDYGQLMGFIGWTF
ncbi:MAG: opacity protein-like surface antigen [Planctomycetota bacterium]|jgi:opacity protein-like surface antigen